MFIRSQKKKSLECKISHWNLIKDLLFEFAGKRTYEQTCSFEHSNFEKTSGSTSL